MPITTILTALSGLKSVATSLGWFSETHWPSELDRTITELERLEGRTLTEIRSLRDKAYSYYKKHHRAMPWDKAHYQKMFNNAVQACAQALQREITAYQKRAEEEAKRAEEEARVAAEAEKITLSKILEKIKSGVSIAKEELSKLPPWALPLIIASVPGVIAVVIAIKRRGE